MGAANSTLWKLFVRNREGGVAIMFSLCILGILGISGLAIEYSRQRATTVTMQAAADYVALALARKSLTVSSGNLQAEANALFAAALAGHDISGASITATLLKGSPNKLVIKTSGSVPSMLGALFGVDTLPASADAEVPIVVPVFEIALVLDNTGSMNGQSKLKELKLASKSLVSIIKGSVEANGAKARISIVPFAKEVKIGTEHTGVNWLDWASFAGSKSNWTGCVSDRNQPHDVKNDKPTGDPFTWYPASNCNLAKILPLTDNWPDLNSKIDGLTASGMTNLTIGAAWGLNMLTPGAPLSTADKNSKYLSRYMIVLTDGMNTKNKWTSDPVQIDARTYQICDNAKAAGIKIYTIRVINGNETLLKSCASSTSMYYNITNASQLTPVFESIAKQLAASIYLGD